MAKPERSKLTEVTIGVQGRLQNLIDHYKENPEKPFMLEQVGKPDARERFKAMTPEQRAEVIQQVGIDSVLELLRKRGTP